MSDPVSQLRGAVTETAAGLAGNGKVAAPKLDRPPRADFGDYSTNAAMLLAPTLGEPPRVIAERLGEALGERLGRAVEKGPNAGAGFLNLFMADAWYVDSLAGMREAGAGFGAGGASPAERVNVEFVSANPTGPLHIGHARNGAYGDALSRILEFHGHDVTREFYVNDYGSQVLRFAESLRARARGEEVPEGGYQGDYVTELAAEIPGAAEMELEELGRAGGRSCPSAPARSPRWTISSTTSGSTPRAGSSSPGATTRRSTSTWSWRAASRRTTPSTTCSTHTRGSRRSCARRGRDGWRPRWRPTCARAPSASIPRRGHSSSGCSSSPARWRRPPPGARRTG